MRTPRLVRAAAAALAIAATLGASAASAAGDIVIRRDGSKAVDVPAAGPTTPTTADGFDLDDAGLGAATVLALVVGSAGVVSLYGRRRSSRPIGTN